MNEPLSSDQKSIIAEQDWNFDDLPRDELEVCCLWEYARESEFIRSVCERSTEAARLRLPFDPQMNPVWRDFMKIFGVLRRRAILFQNGFYDFGENQFPGFVSRFPAPWQSLSKFERSVLMQTAAWSAKKFNGVPGFRRLAQAETLAMTKLFKPKPHKKVFGDRLLPVGEFYHSGHKLRAVCPNFITPQGQEDLAVRIDWAGFTNEQLLKQFAQWLKENEPPGVPRPDGRGHKTSDWRANLTRLAVMRILSRFTPLQIVDTRHNRFPAVWKTKQLSRPKWRDITKWHDARREAGKLYQGFFPFLPKGDRPRSWQRQLPGK